MRKRYYRARVWLDEDEYIMFDRNVEKTGLSKEKYLRQLITGYKPKESPPLEYFELIRQLTIIGRNLNQIAVKLNSLNGINMDALKQSLSQLMRLLICLQKAVETL